MIFQRTKNRTVNSLRLWPVLVIILLAALLPSACVIWFMNAAIENQQLAMRQRMTDLYLKEIEQVRKYIAQRFEGTITEFDRTDMTSPRDIFCNLVLGEVAESVIVYSDDQKVLYPSQSQISDLPQAFRELRDRIESLEFQGDLQQALDVSDGALKTIDDANHKAMLLQVQARCMVKHGRIDDAIKVLQGTLAQEQFADAHDAMGRHVYADAMLFAWSLCLKNKPEMAGSIRQQLLKMVYGYSVDMPSSQRRFLMSQLDEQHPTAKRIRRAEKLADEVMARNPVLKQTGQLFYSDRAQCWVLAGIGGRVVGLYTASFISELIESQLKNQLMLSQVQCRAHPHQNLKQETPPRLTVPISPLLPDWYISVYDSDSTVSADGAHVAAVYLWSAIAVIGFLIITTVAMISYVARSIRLTRMKNDLIATVTHELKTPLASMRLLVDTLRDDRMTDPSQAKEYLDLIASENQRLTRLIDNFLAFSRMERNKNAFVFESVDVTDVINDAITCVKDRFNQPDCELTVDIDSSLYQHAIEADRDALVTVLLNLLDNAWKYTDIPKHVNVRGLAVNGSVFIEVTDNGKGLSKREQSRVFDRFYQVDQSLSRQVGGCGLGLSIVKFIVDAHDGKVTVKSTPGQGSTFTLQFATDRGHLNSSDNPSGRRGDEHA